MTTMLIVSQLLSWIVIAILAAVSLALARQIGVLHARVAPAGALLGAASPRPGERAPVVAAVSLAGMPVTLGGAAGGPLRLFLFVSPDCPMCKLVLPAARSLAEAERIALFAVGDDAPATLDAFARAQGIDPAAMVNSAELGRSWQVDRLPHAVLLAADGTVAARGLVNSREQLESLLVAHESGVPTIQDHFADRRPA